MRLNRLQVSEEERLLLTGLLCEYCGAAPGRRCRAVSGASYSYWYFHGARWAVYEKAFGYRLKERERYQRRMERIRALRAEKLSVTASM